MLKRRWSGLGRRASASVEFALISLFFLIPLFAGGADFVEIMSTQAQLNTALQSLYYFGYTNPTAASDSASITTIINAINANAVHQVATATGNGTVTYTCVTTTVTNANTTGVAPCTSAQTRQTFVSYSLTSSVSLTMSLATIGLHNPLSLAASGKVQVQ